MLRFGLCPYAALVLIRGLNLVVLHVSHCPFSFLREIEDKHASMEQPVSFQSFAQKAKKKLPPLRKIRHLFPIYSWLPKYNWREDLKYDLMAGLNVGIMTIPQGNGVIVVVVMEGRWTEGGRRRYEEHPREGRCKKNGRKAEEKNNHRKGGRREDREQEDQSRLIQD